LFLGAFIAMQTLYGMARGTWIERLNVDELTVKPAAWLIDRLTPEVAVQAVGSRLRAPGGGINIINGCEGTEVVFLIVAAMLVAPMAWRWRLLGIVTGSLLVFISNQGRILSLFYAYRADKPLFDLLHGVVAPLLLVLVTILFFVWWLGRFSNLTPRRG
jgi:exosortase family protein XrtM